MKKIFTLMALLAVAFFVKAQSVAINTDGSNADTSAILDIKSTTKGLLIPRLTLNQRNAIVSPASGLMVYQTNNKKGFYYYNGSGWSSIVDNKNNLWLGTDSTVYTLTSKVGIGTNTPRMSLHISTTTGLGMVIENPVSLAAGLQSGIYFKSSNEYYGAVKAIGTGSDYGRLGFFTYAGADSSQLLERLSIADDGSVGINTITPTETLDVNGTTRTGGLIVTGSANINGSMSSASASTTANLSIGGNASVAGTATVTGKITSGGFGTVVSGNSTQLKIVTYTATLSVTNLAPNSLLGATGNLTIPAGTFSSTPTAYIGDIVAGSENGSYYRVTIIPDQVTTTNVRLKIFNPTASTVSFTSVQWHVMVIGPK